MLWGIPLYASRAELHDEIVGKQGAFDRLRRSLSLLLSGGAAIELRTVVMKQNWYDLPKLAKYVAARLPFIDRWALMQLENIGFGRMNWQKSFQDTSADFGALDRAIDIASARGVETTLFNFPLCSVPAPYRTLAPATISDWKCKHESFCDDCSARSRCGGFFEWYDHRNGFAKLGAL
ncbi:hypothetical protein ACQKGC_22055 [Allorhizobium pseudoryzae]|uniref:hypothetical protein n=1 Tax=Allorhizobium pseudoryzae TaxID=379684 RepID=UPI003D04710F